MEVSISSFKRCMNKVEQFTQLPPIKGIVVLQLSQAI